METLGGLASPNTVSSARVNLPTHLKPTTSKDIGRPNVERTKVLRTRCRKDAMQKGQNVERGTMGKGNYIEKTLCGKAIILKRTQCPKDIIGKGKLH
jgi:hypothetical protein